MNFYVLKGFLKFFNQLSKDALKMPKCSTDCLVDFGMRKHLNGITDTHFATLDKDIMMVIQVCSGMAAESSLSFCKFSTFLEHGGTWNMVNLGPSVPNGPVVPNGILHPVPQAHR